jgi:transposase
MGMFQTEDKGAVVKQPQINRAKCLQKAVQKALFFGIIESMKNILHQQNYLTNARNVQLKIDEFFIEKIIPANVSVRLLDEIVEEMDLSALWRAYKRTGRKPATNPVTLLKILLYANMEGIYSSRSIESSCKRDINFIWLLNGEKAPNHHEIDRFRVSVCRDARKNCFISW